MRLSWLLFRQLPKFFCGNLRIGLRKSSCARQGKRDATDAFRAEVGDALVTAPDWIYQLNGLLRP